MSFCLKGLIGLFIVSSLIASCAKPNTDFSVDPGNIPPYYIKINEGNFTPADLRISAGATVVFVNKTNKIQTLRSKENPLIFNDISIEPEKTFLLKSDTAVVIKYYAGDNPNVQGLIVFSP